MRKEEQIITTIISVAKADERIRGVILNGSRTNKKVRKDDFQDFDVVYLVEDLASFKNSPNWIDVFGERIILQMPNSMKIEEEDIESEEEEITYLMLFKDFNRIDLNLIKVENKEDCNDSLSKVLLDKDKLFTQMLEPTDEDYWVKRPSQKEFSDCCNEFWWVSTYVVKGLARDEITYSKDMLENPVRKMFRKMIAWNVAADYDFSINLGKSNRFLKNYVAPQLITQIFKTYPDYKKINIWNSFLLMTKIFDVTGAGIADKLKLNYNLEEANNVKEYIRIMEKIVFK